MDGEVVASGSFASLRMTDCAGPVPLPHRLFSLCAFDFGTCEEIGTRTDMRPKIRFIARSGIGLWA